ncbi:MAG TPA: gephyrin-like molybdotransferase Glp [Glaciihabitans sp.]|nr:gephyrin-like molybdotransferase Glp [Glaciihabitans sp.]
MTHTHAAVSVDDHLAHVRALITPALPFADTDTFTKTDTADDTSCEVLPLASALGRLTSHAVASPVDLPLFRNSQMDGFAVRAADLTQVPITLPIVGESAARPGSPEPLLAGTAVRIMTGAVVPDGTDSVVPVEDTTAGDGDTVNIHRARAVGEYVRDRGSDILAGTELLPAATLLAPRHLASLAAAGLPTVSVRRRLRVAVITTGAELVAPGEPTVLGQVYDANNIALTTAITSCGAEVSVAMRVSDDVDQMRQALETAADASDLILTSGGISQGDYEVVREVLGPLGARIGHIAMQPGGPQTTAVFQGVPVVSFPGNPVSTQISFAVFVAPLLREYAGLPQVKSVARTLRGDIRSVVGKRQFLRGHTDGENHVVLVAGPGSHLVAQLAASDVLIDIPADTEHVNEGSTVETWQL